MIIYYKILDEIKSMEPDIKSFYNQTRTSGLVTRRKCRAVTYRVIPLLKELSKEMRLIEEERRRKGQVGIKHKNKTSYKKK